MTIEGEIWVTAGDFSVAFGDIEIAGSNPWPGDGCAVVHPHVRGTMSTNLHAAFVALLLGACAGEEAELTCTQEVDDVFDEANRL